MDILWHQPHFYVLIDKSGTGNWWPVLFYKDDTNWKFLPALHIGDA
jgi:hypothetical protein